MSAQGNYSPAKLLALHPKRDRILACLTEAQAEELRWDWRFRARPQQLLPGSEGAALSRSDWIFWVVQAGRGFGKTRTGAEAVREWAQNPNERILMIAPTADDVRSTMIEGPSGLLNCYPPHEKPEHNPSRHLVRFQSGAIGITRSADEPERLRGPQFTKFWADELCAWNYPQQAWDQIMFGFRLKVKQLQGVITTTPKPLKVFKELVKNANTVVTRGSSYDNRDNLSSQYYKAVILPYEGTRLGRQEITAELIEDIEGALWTRQLIEACRIAELGKIELVRIVVAIDPAVSSAEDASETGIVVVGLGMNGHCYVLKDLSLQGTPAQWALTALGAFGSYQADRILGEVNNGGELVEANLRAQVSARGLNPMALPYRAVHASRGKAVRAEPVAALYERGMVHHVGGDFEKLEDQMCGWVPGMGMKSPDRMDALVWAIYDLVVAPMSQGIVTVSNPVVISPY